MSQQCGQCPTLRAEVARLSALVHRQNRHIAYLRQVLGVALGGLRRTVAWIDAERERPTIPRQRLPLAISQQLTNVLDQAESVRE
jgi:hypothetical protein